MEIKRIKFQNFKSFLAESLLEIRPLTVVIGKNSSGKSAFSRLPYLLSQSFSPAADEPIAVKANGVEFGGSFSDLVHNRLFLGKISFQMFFSDDTVLSCELQGIGRGLAPVISKWGIQSPYLNLELKIQLTDDNIKRRSGITYIGADGIYGVTFRGLLPIEVEKDGEKLDFRDFDQLERDLGYFSRNVNYVGPYRQIPERVYFHTGIAVSSIGVKGENAPQILVNSLSLDNNLVERVGNWYAENLGGWKLQVQQVEDFFQLVLLSPDDPSVMINILDVGQGMNQVLPLIVQCLKPNKPHGSVCIVEQPELHLHPAAHAALAELFANSAKQDKVNYILETHSENFILRFRRLIVEGKLSSEDVIIYWIDDESRPGSKAKEILIEPDGELTDWPTGVFSEDYDEVLAIREAQKRKNAS